MIYDQIFNIPDLETCRSAFTLYIHRRPEINTFAQPLDQVSTTMPVHPLVCNKTISRAKYIIQQARLKIYTQYINEMYNIGQIRQLQI